MEAGAGRTGAVFAGCAGSDSAGVLATGVTADDVASEHSGVIAMPTVGVVVSGEVSWGIAAVGPVTGGGSGGMIGGCGEAVGVAICDRIRSSFRCCAWTAS